MQAARRSAFAWVCYSMCVGVMGAALASRFGLLPILRTGQDLMTWHGPAVSGLTIASILLLSSMFPVLRAQLADQAGGGGEWAWPWLHATCGWCGLR